MLNFQILDFKFDVHTSDSDNQTNAPYSDSENGSSLIFYWLERYRPARVFIIYT